MLVSLVLDISVASFGQNSHFRTRDVECVLNESPHESIKIGSGPDELPHEPTRLVSGPQLVWICAPYLDWSGCASGLDVESVCCLGCFLCTIGIFL